MDKKPTTKKLNKCKLQFMMTHKILKPKDPINLQNQSINKIIKKKKYLRLRTRARVK